MTFEHVKLRKIYVQPARTYMHDFHDLLHAQIMIMHPYC